LKTQKQAYDEARPMAEPLRAKAIAAAQLVEKQKPPAAGATCKSTKKLTFNPKSDAHDTDFIMFEEAKRGAAKRDDKQPEEDLDLHFATNPFPVLLRGTSTNSMYESYMLGDPANGDFLDRIKRGGSVKNLIVVRSNGTTVDYFLVDIAPAAPVVLCSGTFRASADPSLGTRTESYDLVTKNKRTGKEVGRTSHTDTHDDRKNALYVDAHGQFAARMKSELGIPALE
jgi:hypothetical protein